MQRTWRATTATDGSVAGVGDVGLLVRRFGSDSSWSRPVSKIWKARSRFIALLWTVSLSTLLFLHWRAATSRLLPKGRRGMRRSMSF